MAPVSVGEAARTERAFAMLVSGNYFEAPGLTPRRPLHRGQRGHDPGGEPVVAVSMITGGRGSGAAPPRWVNGCASTTRTLRSSGLRPRFPGTDLGLQFILWIPVMMALVLTAGCNR